MAKLTLHLPRKGMETMPAHSHTADHLQLTLHLPRKGMETTKVSPFLSIFYGVLTLHLPRKGMETLDRVVDKA